ncbi:hypothetical protein EGY31_21980 [Burkholderia multivorans]|nr:hypothetical protein EGY31_21980 [Burkholderia multivorans]
MARRLLHVPRQTFSRCAPLRPRWSSNRPLPGRHRRRPHALPWHPASRTRRAQPSRPARPARRRHGRCRARPPRRRRLPCRRPCRASVRPRLRARRFTHGPKSPRRRLPLHRASTRRCVRSRPAPLNGHRWPTRRRLKPHARLRRWPEQLRRQAPPRRCGRRHPPGRFPNHPPWRRTEPPALPTTPRRTSATTMQSCCLRSRRPTPPCRRSGLKRTAS